MATLQTAPGLSSPGRASTVAPDAGPETAPAPPPDPRLPQVYRHAAQLIWEHGWAQGYDIDADSGRMCATHALYLAALDVAPDNPALVVNARYWLSARMLGGTKVQVWNDHRCREVEDVTDLLDRAADLAEAAL
jgi:hypothetical protein